jgi:hypothetical protein
MTSPIRDLTRKSFAHELFGKSRFTTFFHLQLQSAAAIESPREHCERLRPQLQDATVLSAS